MEFKIINLRLINLLYWCTVGFQRYKSWTLSAADNSSQVLRYDCRIVNSLYKLALKKRHIGSHVVQNAETRSQSIHLADTVRSTGCPFHRKSMRIFINGKIVAAIAASSVLLTVISYNVQIRKFMLIVTYKDNN